MNHYRNSISIAASVLILFVLSSKSPSSFAVDEHSKTVIPGNTVRALEVVSAALRKRNIGIEDHEFTVTEFPDQYRISVISYSPKTGLYGYGGCSYRLSKSTFEILDMRISR